MSLLRACVVPPSSRGVSRRLIAAFVLLLLLPAAAVVWLGIRLVIQDRQLEAEGLRKLFTISV